MNLSTQIKKITDTINGNITYRITAMFVLCFAVIGVVVLALTLRFARSFDGSLNDSLSASTQQFASLLAECDDAGTGIATGSQKPLERVSGLARQNPDVIYIVFYNRNREPIFKVFKQGLTINDFDFPVLREPAGAAGKKILSLDGEEFYDAFAPILMAAGAAGGSVFGDEYVADGSGLAKNRIGGWVRIGMSTQKISDMNRSLTMAVSISTILVVIVILIINVFIQVSVAKPLTGISEAAREIGKGNLATKIKVRSNDEIGALVRSFNEMSSDIEEQIRKTSGMVKGLMDTIEQISRTTSEIFTISAQQSSGATQQAASVYQASSTSKEIAASATRIADTAEEVAAYARQTSSASDQGKVELGSAIHQVRDMAEKTGEVAARMVELGEKSQKISGIIDIINEISEQTNLLSLNAAIEASGAGEAGKRFGVVAQEIRRLAGKTLEATQVIIQIIEEIQAATNTAVMVTEQSTKSAQKAQSIIDSMNQSFQSIMEMVDQTLRASTEINLSTRQQTTACEQMVSTIMEVSEVASEVEKGAKETEAAVESLRRLAMELKSLAESTVADGEGHDDQRS